MGGASLGVVPFPAKKHKTDAQSLIHSPNGEDKPQTFDIQAGS
jgi:hypothetical protein